MVPEVRQKRKVKEICGVHVLSESLRPVLRAQLPLFLCPILPFVVVFGNFIVFDLRMCNLS